MDPSKEMEQLEQLVESLRVKYVLYFAGRDPFEPQQYRWQVEAMIRRLQKERVTNPAFVNRLRAVVQKMGNYQALWNRARILKKKLNTAKIADKEIEEAFSDQAALPEIFGDTAVNDAAAAAGTMRENPAVDGAVAGEPVTGEPEDTSLVDEMAQAAEEAFAALPEEEKEGEKEQVFSFSVPDPVDALYEQFVDAKRKTGEPVAGFSLEGFRRQILGQEQALANRFPGREFRFVVVVTDGKASIKAVPRVKK
ncbi:MAG: MXAN_5187 C-terminal domain-containing protein [Myxococcota bacterium]|jgi:hypothetical protein